AGAAAVPRERNPGELSGADHGRRAGDDPAQVRPGHLPGGGVELPGDVLLRGAYHLRAAGRAAWGTARRHLVRAVRGMRGGAGFGGTAAPQRDPVRLPDHRGYGLTEGTCASVVSPVDGVRKPGTVGVALP